MANTDALTTPIQRAILALIRAPEGVSVTSMRERLSPAKSRRIVRRSLNRLVALGLLRVSGSRRPLYWHPRAEGK